LQCEITAILKNQKGHEYLFAMSFTQTDLDNIESAIAENALEVRDSNGRWVKYASMSDLLKRRDLIKREMGLTNKTTRIFTKFSKGL